MTVERGALRVMIGRYVKEPDVVSWLAAADLLEERGGPTDLVAAAMWRRRAKFFPPLIAAVEELRTAEVGHLRRVDLGPFCVEVRRSRGSARMRYWRRGVGGSESGGDWCGYETKQGQRYVNKKCLSIIDAIHHLMTCAGE